MNGNALFFSCSVLQSENLYLFMATVSHLQPFFFKIVFQLQTGEGLEGRSSKGRERAGGNPQGHPRVWGKAIQQSAAERCERSFSFSNGPKTPSRHHDYFPFLKGLYEK